MSRKKSADSLNNIESEREFLRRELQRGKITNKAIADLAGKLGLEYAGDPVALYDALAAPPELTEDLNQLPEPVILPDAGVEE